MEFAWINVQPTKTIIEKRLGRRTRARRLLVVCCLTGRRFRFENWMMTAFEVAAVELLIDCTLPLENEYISHDNLASKIY